MRKFKSEDTYNLKDRGTVYIVTPTETVPYNEVFNMAVEIDGITGVCIGIERFAKCRPTPDVLEKGEPIGILLSIVPLMA